MTSVRYENPEDVTPGAVARGKETPVVASLDNSSVTACTSRGNDTPPLVLSEGRNQEGDGLENAAVIAG